MDNVPRVVDGRKIGHLTTGGHGRSLDDLIEKASDVSGLGTD
jgi:hypothetical protein